MNLCLQSNRKDNTETEERNTVEFEASTKVKQHAGEISYLKILIGKLYRTGRTKRNTETRVTNSTQR